MIAELTWADAGRAIAALMCEAPRLPEIAAIHVRGAGTRRPTEIHLQMSTVLDAGPEELYGRLLRWARHLGAEPTISAPLYSSTGCYRRIEARGTAGGLPVVVWDSLPAGFVPSVARLAVSR